MKRLTFLPLLLPLFFSISCHRQNDLVWSEVAYPDSDAPSIFILSPTADDVYVTTEHQVRVSGIAEDNQSVASVFYTTDSGIRGDAVGLNEWSIPDLTLKEGDNVVTITARDQSGNESSASLTITQNRYLTFLGIPYVDRSVLYQNVKTTVWITASIAPNIHLDRSSVRLILVDDQYQEIQEVCPLYDDGNLDYGDEIKGDNVFSAKYSFRIAEERSLRLRVAAQSVEEEGVVEGYSSVFTIRVINKQKAQEEVNSMLDTQKQIEAFLSGISDLSPEQQKEQLIEWMAEEPKIASFSIDGDLIEITHDSGIISYVSFINDNTSKGAGTSADGLRQGPSVPLHMQTRGEYVADLSSGYATKGSGQVDADHIIHNKNVLIWAPYFSGKGAFEQAMETSLRPIFDNSPVDFDIKYMTDAQCTRASLMDMTKYGIVVFDTHGSGGNLIYTRELVDDSDSFVEYLISNFTPVVTMVEGYYDAWGTYYAVTAKFVREVVSGTFPNSIIFNGSCQSMKTSKLSSAFIGKGAKAYLGFTKNVGVPACIEKADEFFSALVGPELKTVGDSFIQDIDFTDGNHLNSYLMSGDPQMRFYLGLLNGDFEYGNMNGWSVSGDGRIITGLGPLTPTQGHYMGIVSTGLGYTKDFGSISQTFHVTDEKTLSINWNFLSEEFLEFVGTQYQDYFRIIVNDGNSNEVLFSKAIDSFAEEFSLSPVSPTIEFDQGDVYMTRWMNTKFDIRKYQGKTITLIIMSGDIGDSIYDSAVLLDEITVN